MLPYCLQADPQPAHSLVAACCCCCCCWCRLIRSLWSGRTCRYLGQRPPWAQAGSGQPVSWWEVRDTQPVGVYIQLYALWERGQTAYAPFNLKIASW